MADDADAAADHAVAADGNAAGNTGFGGNHGVLADMAVVTDLHLVVDFGAAADGGVAHRAAVDIGVGADFDVVVQRNRAGLRDFEPGIAGKGQAEAVGADHRAAVDFHPRAERAAVINHGIGVQHGVVAERAAVFDHRAGQDAAALAEHGIGADIGMGADFARRGHGGGGFDHGGGMHAGAGSLNGMEQPRHLREVEIGVAGDNQAAAGKAVGGVFADNHRTGGAGFDFVAVFGVGEKGNLVCTGTGGRGDGGNGDVGAAHFAAEPGGDLGKGVGGHGNGSGWLSGCFWAGSGSLKRETVFACGFMVFRLPWVKPNGGRVRTAHHLFGLGMFWCAVRTLRASQLRCLCRLLRIRLFSGCLCAGSGHSSGSLKSRSGFQAAWAGFTAFPRRAV